ncbi:hemicentin-1-like [Saccostrea cucullata]|uniref:hemicentin-1-like n=1 Tax=Saccostrea cuccullata TaxID=36930 RepID=UPI002ED5F1DA
MTLDREGNLHFLNINLSYGAKDYYCGVWNDNEQIFRKGNLLNLIVQDSADSFVPPRAVYHSGYKAYPGENATLQCIFSGNPVLEVTWQTRNGSHIVENHRYSIRHGGKELHIRNATFKDDEVYKCVSNDNIQNPYLNVTAYPFFPSVHKRFMMKIDKFTINRSTEIMCNAISAPDEMEPVVIMWMKNGKKLNQESRYQLSDDKKKLHIYKTKLEDAGCYTCVVENSEGTAVANFLLHDSYTVPSPDQMPRRPLIIKILPLICIAAIFLLIASMISTKKIRQITKNKQRLHVEREGDGRFSGAIVNVYSEPDPENQDHLHIERVSDLNASSEGDLWSEVVDTENIYDILGDFSAVVADSSELRSYDCMENIQGIYNTSYRANVQTFKDAIKGPETMGQRESVEISRNSFPMMTGENISECRILVNSEEYCEINFNEKDLFDDESNDTLKVAASETNNKSDDALDKTEGISSQNSESYGCN